MRAVILCFKPDVVKREDAILKNNPGNSTGFSMVAATFGFFHAQISF